MATSVLRLFSVFSTAFFLAAGDLSVAQQPPPPAPAPPPQQAEPLPPVDLEPADERPAPSAPLVPPEQPIRLTFPNTSVTEILSLYEVLTGKRLVRDSALAQGRR